MTIRLLAKYDKYDANTIVTLDAATEAGLIAQRLATTDTTGGVPYVPPVLPNQRYDVQVEIDPNGSPLGLIGPSGNRLALGAGQGGPRAVLIGDSNTFQNYEQVFIVSAKREGGVVTLTTSNIPFWVFVGSPIQVEGVPDEFRGVQTITAFNDTTKTYSYACPGPDVASIPLVANGEQASFANLAKYMDNGWFVWSNILSNQRFELVRLFAQYGRRTDKMIDMIREPVSVEADVAFVMAGTNDVVLDNRSASYITARLQTIYKALRDSGKFVYALTIMPLGSSYWSTAKTATIIEVNNWIKRYCRTTPGMQSIDVFGALVDPLATNKGQAKAGVLQNDNLHLSQLGAFTIGKAVRDATANLPLLDFRTTSNADNYGTSSTNANILDFAPWTSTGGDVGAQSGTLGAGYAGAGIAGGTAVFSAPVRADGYGFNSRAVITAAAANDGARIATSATAIPLARFPAGATLQADISVSVTGNGGLFKNMQFTAGSGQVVAYGLGVTLPTAAQSIKEDWSGIIRTPAIQFPAAFIANPVTRLDTTLNAAGSITVEAGRAQVLAIR